jgi:predicted O-methyltransferase YrrM
MVLVVSFVNLGVMVLTKADGVLSEIEKLAEGRFLPIVGPAKGMVLVEVVRKTAPKRVLEVGTLIGYSAILIGRQLSSGSQLITIEIHEEEAKAAETNIKKAEISAKVGVLVGDALEILPKLTGKFDLVFIDATKEEYLEYLRSVEPKLHKGNVIVADNAGIFAEQMKDYLDYVRNSGKYRSRFVSVGEDGLEISERL